MRPTHALASLVLASVTCAKQAPATTYVEFKDPEIIRLIRERPVENVPSEPAPGDDDLTNDAPPNEATGFRTTLLALQPTGNPPPWHCFSATLKKDIEIGECFASADVCASRRKKSVKAGARVGACREQPRAACFYFEMPLKDIAGHACFESFEACSWWNLYFKQDTETRNVGECEARRISETF